MDTCCPGKRWDAMERNSNTLEIMKLQEELEDTKNAFYKNMKLWTDRFQELDKECSILKEKLLKKSKCIQKLTMDNINLLREKEKLVDIFPKHGCRINTLRNEVNSTTRNTIQLNTDTKKYFPIKTNSLDNNVKISGLNYISDCTTFEIDVSEQDDTHIMIETYRIAFEELLARNRELILKLSRNDNI